MTNLKDWSITNSGDIVQELRHVAWMLITLPYLFI